MSVKGAAFTRLISRALRPAVNRVRWTAVLSIGAGAVLLAGCGVYSFGSTISTGSGPGFPNVHASRNLVTHQLDLSGFSQLDVRNTIKAEVRQSDGWQVELTTDDNMVEFVEVVKEGQTLRFSLRPGTYYGATLRVRVAMPVLDKVSVSGASQVDLQAVKAELFTASVAGASQLTGSLEATDLDLTALGASTASLRGRAESARLSAAGASHLDLSGLQIDAAKATLKDASAGTVTVKAKLGVDLSGASRLSYYGSPRMESISTSGASTLTRK